LCFLAHLELYLSVLFILLGTDCRFFSCLLALLALLFHPFFLLFLLLASLGGSQISHHFVDSCLQVPAARFEGVSGPGGVLDTGHIAPAKHHVDLVFLKVSELHVYVFLFKTKYY
jgi:hypothetical protein